jgi:hypothetical protein
MTTTASKLYLGASVAALLSAFAYGWGTGGGLTGVMLFGLLGGVGELIGYTILVSTAGVLLFLGSATSVLRDADPEQQAAVARLEVAPAVTAPSPSYWPAVGALTVVVAIVGLIASPVVFVIGCLGTLVVTLEWMVTAWSERATGDPEVNRQIRNRLLYPIEIPVAGALGILILVVSLSRVFLALGKISTAVVAIVIGSVILGLAFLIAYRPNLPKDAIAALLVVGALAVLAAGIAAAANGPREFEHHGEESESHDGGEALAPLDTLDLLESIQ